MFASLKNDDIICFLRRLCRTEHRRNVKVFVLIDFLRMNNKCEVDVLRCRELTEGLNRSILQVKLIESLSLRTEQELQVVDDNVLDVVLVNRIFDRVDYRL